MESNNPYNAPPQSTAPAHQGLGLRRVRIKRLDPISVAVMLGVLYAVIGLIVGGVFSLLAILGVAVGGEAGIGGLIGGVAALVILPVLYGVLGFIGGLIIAVLYNLVAGMAGGIQVDLEG